MADASKSANAASSPSVELGEGPSSKVSTTIGSPVATDRTDPTGRVRSFARGTR